MITRYLYRNPRIVWLILATVIVAGVSCLIVMPRLEDPILGRRVGVVTTTLHGADATEIESTVTIPIEQWLNEFSEIKQIRSNTRTNICNVVIELHDRITDPEPVWSAIENRLLTNAKQLPAECDDPELSVFPLKAYAAIVAIVPTTDEAADPFQWRRLAKQLRSRMLGINGTESVEIFGDPGEQLVVTMTPQMLATTGLSPGAVAQQIAASQRVPSGDVEQSGMHLTVDLLRSGELIDRIERIGIRIPGDPNAVNLSGIATVTRQIRQPQTNQAIVGGSDAIVLGMMVDDDSRVDLWAREFEQVAADFKLEFPGAYEIEPLFMQSEQILRRMHHLIMNLTISATAVVLLVFLLMGWRCMIVVAAALPLSACLVIVGLRLLSIPIHQMSVTGLIVALGLLIDNAIVMVEEVRSRVFDGVRPLAAITDSIHQLGMPLFGSTLTTILAFLPIATMPGPSGEFVGSIAISVILAISASFLLSITIIPPLVFMLGVNEQRTGFLDYGIRIPPLEWLYRQSLKLAFRFPLLAIAFSVILPIAGFRRVPNLERQFFPASDRSQIQAELELSANATMEATRESVDRLRFLMANDRRILSQNWFIGQSAPTFYYNVVPRRRGTPYYAQAFVDIEPDADVDQLVNQLQMQIDAEVFDARVVIRKLEQGPPFDAPIEVRLIGNDVQLLEDMGNQLRTILSKMPMVTHTRSDLGDTVPKLTLDLDPAVLRNTRLGNRDVSRFLYGSLEGVAAGTFFEDGEQIPVRVQVDFSRGSLIDSLSALPVGAPAPPLPAGSGPAGSATGPDGAESVPAPTLGSLGQIELASEVGAIIRLDGERVNEVKAYLLAGVLPSVALEEFKRALQAADVSLPDGYRIEFGGEAEKRSQAVSTLIANAAVLFVVMLLTLVATQGSFRSAALIASVGGLAIGLGPLALYSFNYPFGFMAIVGTMGLVGVAINDSIVVLAAIRSNERLGQDRFGRSDDEHEFHDAGNLDAEVEAAEPEELADVVFGCTRHVITTTLTTMIGFLPLVLDGGRFWPPLAIVISSGVAAATLLALYYVPALHVLLNGRKAF